MIRDTLASLNSTSAAIHASTEQADASVQLYRMQRALDELSSIRGQSTSMISLYMPPRTPMSRLSNLITEAKSSASCIKKTKNRKSVLDALASIEARTKNIREIPANGSVIFCGTYQDGDKDRRVFTMLEPIKPVQQFSYTCGSTFATDKLKEMCETDDTYGFIVVDGNGTLYATLSGNRSRVLHHFDVSLPSVRNSLSSRLCIS
jgi:peptide chain release factor subunit 1